MEYKAAYKTHLQYCNQQSMVLYKLMLATFVCKLLFTVNSGY